MTLVKPSDCHIHLRDGESLTRTVQDATRQFCQAIVMPNLQPPVTDIAPLVEYRARIQENIPANQTFKPLMTLYLTDKTDPKLVKLAKQNDVIAFKLYPAGATTNSAQGVTAIENVYDVLEAMQTEGLPLCIHGEVTDSDVDIFDREKVFIEKTLNPLIKRFPRLKIILEHITTEQAVAFVESTENHIAATITPHHLLLNRNHIFEDGIKPHHYCLPVLKRATHQQALLRAATSGNPKFFLGTDSAPHAIARKESSCGCAGIYNAYNAIELYAEIFEQAGALNKLERFASFFGPEFYQIPIVEETITLEKTPWEVPKTLTYGNTMIKPLFAGETLQWKLK